MLGFVSLGVEAYTKALKPDSDPDRGSVYPTKVDVLPPGSDLRAFFFSSPSRTPSDIKSLSLWLRGRKADALTDKTAR